MEKNEIDSLWEWDDFIRFQLNIAERWYKRGEEAGDLYSKFFFFFTGFNALYFLWRKIDIIERSEGRQIENLLKKLGEENADKILSRIKNSVDYFVQRNPIQRMDERTKNNPYEGSISEGRKWRNILMNEKNTCIDRIAALGNILYLIRSNLVHGSKAVSGDDYEIIRMSIKPISILLKETLILTENLSPLKRMT